MSEKAENPQITEGNILSPELFEVDYPTSGKLHGMEINPEAIKVFGEGIRVRLLNLKDKVVRFKGSFEDFVEFVRRAQENPLREVDGNVRDYTDYHVSASLRRTGVSIIMEDSTLYEDEGGFKRNIWQGVKGEEGCCLRHFEIVGVSENKDIEGVYYLMLMRGPTTNLSVYPSDWCDYLGKGCETNENLNERTKGIIERALKIGNIVFDNGSDTQIQEASINVPKECSIPAGSLEIKLLELNSEDLSKLMMVVPENLVRGLDEYKPEEIQ